MGVIGGFIKRHDEMFSMGITFLGVILLFLFLLGGIDFLVEKKNNNDFQRQLEAMQLELEWREKYGNKLVDEVFNSNNIGNTVDINSTNDNKVDTNSSNDSNISNPLLNNSNTNNPAPVEGESGQRFYVKYYEKINCKNQSGYMMVVTDKQTGRDYILHDGF